MTQLRALDGVSARALELLVLTGTRSNEMRGAQWSEIDLAKAVWVIPIERLKNRHASAKLSRLSSRFAQRAVEILAEMPEIRRLALHLPRPLSPISPLERHARFFILLQAHGPTPT